MTQLPAYMQNRTTRRKVATQVHDGLGMGSMPAVSIKGNQFTLVDSSGNEKPIETRWLDCIIVDTNPGVSRTFWGLDSKGQPAGYSEGTVGPPVCFSDNGIGASDKATEPQSTSCRSCAMSQFNWPSKIDPSKRTSACRPTKKVAILAFVKGATGQDGVYRGDTVEFPFAMRIPITSHENLRTYSNKFINQAFDVSDVVTRIKFVHGQVGLLDFEAVGFIDEELDEEINKIAERKITDALVGRGDQPIQALPAPGAARPAPPQPQGQLQPATPAITSPFANTQPAEPAEPAKRKRRTKAEMEAARGEPLNPQPANPSPVPFAAPQQAHVESASQQAPVAPFARASNGPVPNHGIVSNAPEPTEDMSKTLEDLFKLPT